MISFTGAIPVVTASKQHYQTLKSYAFNATEPSFHFEPQGEVSIKGPKGKKMYQGMLVTGDEKTKIMEYRAKVRSPMQNRQFMQLIECFEDYMHRLKKQAGHIFELKDLEDLRKIPFLADVELNISHIGIFKNIKVR